MFTVFLRLLRFRKSESLDHFIINQMAPSTSATSSDLQGRMEARTQEQEVLKRNAATLIISCSSFDLDAHERADNDV